MTATCDPPEFSAPERRSWEAENGYDVDELIARRPKRGRPALGSSPASVESVRLDPELKEEPLQRHGTLRAGLEADGRRLVEPDLRIAAIVLSRDATLVTGNVRHFTRVPELRIENRLVEES